MSELIFLVQEADEGGYTARALSVGIFTEAETLYDLKASIKEATLCHFDDLDMPKMIRLHFVKEEVFAL